MQDAAIDPGVEIERLFRSEGHKLWRALLLATGDPDVASDAAAEAFAQALRRDADLRDPAAWIWRAAFRIAAGEMKARTRVEAVSVGVVQEMPESFLDLWAALQRLTLHQRTAVVLADYAGWSHREIAGAMGSTVSAVGVHVYRARRRLRELLEDRDD